MKNWPLFLPLILLSSFCHAEKPLDLELDTSKFYEDNEESSWMLNEQYQSAEKQLSNQCQEMKKQIIALKGKPQRKFALQQRYEAECLKK